MLAYALSLGVGLTFIAIIHHILHERYSRQSEAEVEAWYAALDRLSDRPESPTPEREQHHASA